MNTAESDQCLGRGEIHIVEETENAAAWSGSRKPYQLLMQAGRRLVGATGTLLGHNGNAIRSIEGQKIYLTSSINYPDHVDPIL